VHLGLHAVLRNYFVAYSPSIVGAANAASALLCLLIPSFAAPRETPKLRVLPAKRGPALTSLPTAFLRRFASLR